MTHCSENSLSRPGQAAAQEAQAGTLGAQHIECGLATPRSCCWACCLGAFGPSGSCSYNRQAARRPAGA